MKKLKERIVEYTPCPYIPIGNGLAIVNIKQMVVGYAKLQK
jgi:hypothetical protein